LRQNREYLDWWLLQRFPGKTLEELDGVDWLRLQRAEQVGRIVDIEQRLKAWHKRKVADKRADDFTTDEWRTIRQHDEWAREQGLEYGD
jgi:hypothetical protein